MECVMAPINLDPYLIKTLDEWFNYIKLSGKSAFQGILTCGTNIVLCSIAFQKNSNDI